MDVLLRLAAADGAPVLRQALLDEVWPRRAVNDEVLSRAIADLRTVLGDDARVPRFVETLPKVGYRLVAPVSPAAAPPAGVPPSAASRPRRRVAAWSAAIALVLLLGIVLAWQLRPPPADSLRARLERQLARAEFQPVVVTRNRDRRPDPRSIELGEESVGIEPDPGREARAVRPPGELPSDRAPGHTRRRLARARR